MLGPGSEIADRNAFASKENRVRVLVRASTIHPVISSFRAASGEAVRYEDFQRSRAS